VADRDALIRMSRGIFTDGRFYHDPFFSSEEADRLYETWTANLLDGLADKVFISGDAGFIGCALKGGTGDIPLVGVAEGSQGRGIGTDLVKHALSWFGSQRVDEVTVRTQAGNRRAAALYQRCGFGVKETAVTMGRAV
jgi:ribosomal protein S18 acetylase RimI-like enzyme